MEVLVAVSTPSSGNYNSLRGLLCRTFAQSPRGVAFLSGVLFGRVCAVLWGLQAGEVVNLHVITVDLCALLSASTGYAFSFLFFFFSFINE